LEGHGFSRAVQASLFLSVILSGGAPGFGAPESKDPYIG